jgi:uncharacterized membrane protein
VTLPGAFVGAIFAGASPLVAAEFQVLVLASILVTGALTVGLFTWIFGAPTVIPLGGKLRVDPVRQVRGSSGRSRRTAMVRETPR